MLEQTEIDCSLGGSRVELIEELISAGDLEFRSRIAAYWSARGHSLCVPNSIHSLFYCWEFTVLNNLSSVFFKKDVIWKSVN